VATKGARPRGTRRAGGKSAAHGRAVASRSPTVSRRSVVTRAAAKQAVAPRAAAEGTIATGSAADFIPPRPTLAKLREAAARCRGCHLWMLGSQTVFGEGPETASVMLVGEQPGDQEDREGRPFVGPSGKLLDAALQEAGIDRGDVYVTNAVKHFKWERGEKSARRIHKKPNSAEIAACYPWLETEIKVIEPDVIVALGATAAQALLGRAFRVTKDRGKPIPSSVGPTVIATVHPSSVLRAPDADSRARAERAFFADLRVASRFIHGRHRVAG
jgi:uracil-DNA glycosylase family protein